MYNYVLFWISYLLFELQLIWFFKRFFRDTPSRACKTRCESLETNIPPYVLNKYRIEVKIIFVLAAYLVLLCEFFWEFSTFRFCRRLVDISGHPLLKRNLRCSVKKTTPGLGTFLKFLLFCFKQKGCLLNEFLAQIFFELV